MGLFENFPYTDMYRVDLDWLLRKVKEFQDNMEEYAAQYGNLEGYIHNEVYNYLGEDANIMAAIDDALERYGLTVEGLEASINDLESYASYNSHISNSERIIVNSGAAMTWPADGYLPGWAGTPVGAGNDETGDGTVAAPFATLRRAMEELDRLGNGRAIVLMGAPASAGIRTYTWDWWQTDCVQIHFRFVGEYARLIIDGGTQRNRIYNSYFHFEGHNANKNCIIDVQNSGASDNMQMYLEPGAWYFHNLRITSSANGHHNRLVTRGVVTFADCYIDTATAVTNGFGNYTNCEFHNFNGEDNTGMIYAYSGSTLYLTDNEFYNSGNYPACVRADNSVVHLAGECTYHYTGSSTDATPILAGVNNQIGARSQAQLASWTKMDTVNHCTMTRSKAYAEQNQLAQSNPALATAYGPYPLTLTSDIIFKCTASGYGTRTSFLKLTPYITSAMVGTTDGGTYITNPMVAAYASGKYALYWLQVYVTGQGKLNIQYIHKLALDTMTHTNYNTASDLSGEFSIDAIMLDA